MLRGVQAVPVERRSRRPPDQVAALLQAPCRARTSSTRHPSWMATVAACTGVSPDALDRVRDQFVRRAHLLHRQPAEDRLSKRRCRGGAGSTMEPPPIVSIGE